MNTFEYKQVEFSSLTKPYYDELDVEKLNKLGLEGWELIGVFSGQCLFKRKKS